MLNVNNKILWLADYNLDEAPGGAQRSDEMIIQQGKRLGYNIKKVTHSCIEENLNLNDFDVIVSSNIHALTIKNKNLIEDISKHKYHIRLEHDSNEYLSQEDRIKLFSNCQKTIFLSAFHYQFFNRFYGDIFKNIEIVYDPIDTNYFSNKNNERENKILYAGYLHPLKGAYEFFEYVLNYPDKQFVIAGWPSNSIIFHLCKTIKNVEFLGIIDYEKMPDIYNRYKYLFYNPNLNEPFCRSVAEAVLCGLQIITNKAENIGCLSELKKNGIKDFKDKCNNAAFKFWQII